MSDHVHILIGLNPKESISELVKTIKSDSNGYINIGGRSKNYKFEWQEGYGAFSVSRSQLKNVILYIEQQEERHKKITFMEEYKGFLKNHGIDYNGAYVFKDLE